MPEARYEDAEHHVQDNNTTISTFLGLPLEVRQLIYKRIFADTSVWFLRAGCETKLPLRLANVNTLFVSKDIYHEACPVYTNTRFCLGGFPSRRQSDWHTTVTSKFGHNIQHVARVYCGGDNPGLVLALGDLFANLKFVELDLGGAFIISTHNNFDWTMKRVLLFGDWRHTIKLALGDRFLPGMEQAVAKWKHLGPRRGFEIKLLWELTYPRLEFQGEADLDEWVLRVWGPEGDPSKVYEIPQGQLNFTWAEERLTLPAA